ncbi:MAG: hypothetical protein OXG04_06815 [Acidobacteria bacterium]|nr:hypothetical protein [Acidobacteriota bacterium]
MTVVLVVLFGVALGAVLGYGIAVLDYSGSMAERRRARYLALLHRDVDNHRE